MLYFLLSLSLFFTFPAQASDLPSEGIFLNHSNESLICLKDVDGCIQSQPLSPGRACQADAILLANDRVFKIPNHTAYLCTSEGCGALDVSSWLIMQYGKHWKRGPEHYEVMELYEFSELMGNKWCAYE